MREAIRVAVIDAAFCINVDCFFCACSHLGGANDYVDCRRRECDNHKRAASLTPTAPNEPPFDLPPESKR